MTEIRCGLCGTLSSHEFAKPANSREAPDLDTRPGEPMRPTMKSWMQLCPECGYAASDISSIHEDAVALIETEEYQRPLFDKNIPEVARRFFCHAMILNHVKQYADAGWTALHAAWACDDANSDINANRARDLAITYWKHGKRHGQAFGEPIEEFALAADVLRRAGHFEDALIACTEGIDSEDVPDFLQHVLLFEKTLIQRRDAGRYRMDAVPGLR